MRVAIPLSDVDVTPTSGGAYTWTAALLAALSDATGNEFRHDPLLIGSDPARLRQLASASKVAVVELRSAVPPAVLVQDLQRARRLARRFATEVHRRVPGREAGGPALVTQEDGPPGSLEALVKANSIDVVWDATPNYVSLTCPYVATVWDLAHRMQPIFPEVGNPVVFASREQMYKSHLQRASVVVAGSERCKEEVSFFYQIPPERIEVIPFPTPSFALDDDLEDPKEHLLDLGIRTPYFIYPAQYWPHKNHVNLLLALDAIGRERGLRPGLVLVGSDRNSQQAYVQRWVEKLRLQDQVRMLGFVPTASLVALYRGAIALPYVGFFGPDNLPPLEAFALGCPVIASDIPGARAQYGDAALYVDPTDVDGLAAAMAAMCESRELRDSHMARGLTRAGEWSATDYVRRVSEMLDRLEAIRRCWPPIGDERHAG